MPEAYRSKVTVARKPLCLNRQKALISRGLWQQVLGGDLNAANPSRQVWTAAKPPPARAIGTVESVGVGLGPVVPEIHDAVHATIKRDGDLPVTLFRGRRFKVGDALFEV